MRKEEFLKILQARLIELGIPEENAKKETEHVRTYLSKSGMDELDISVDEMADGIISMLNDNPDSEKINTEIVIPIFPTGGYAGESVSDELEAAIAAIDAESQTKTESSELESSNEIAIPVAPELNEPQATEDHTETAETVSELAEVSEEPAIDATELPNTEVESGNVETTVNDEAVSDLSNEKNDPNLEQKPVQEFAEQPIQPQSEIPPAQNIDDDTDIEEFIPYDKKRRMKNNDSVKKSGNEWLYVSILVVTIPIAIALLLIALVLYLGFWVGLALAMIACIAVLVVFVTVGAVVSLVGIVYGVVQLITGAIPVGLFEVGLGIIVGSVVMFVGILVYNFAVRFIPFGMRLLAKLFRSGFRAIKGGYQSLKGAVDNI